MIKSLVTASLDVSVSEQHAVCHLCDFHVIVSFIHCFIVLLEKLYFNCDVIYVLLTTRKLTCCCTGQFGADVARLVQRWLGQKLGVGFKKLL